MTESVRYSIEDAVPEWKHPEDPLETRIGPDGQVAVRLVLWNPGSGVPAARWIRIWGRCGQITVDLLEDEAVAGWPVASTGGTS